MRLIFAVVALIIGASAEELLPKFCGVGFPVLMAASHSVAVRWSAVAAVTFAIAAGAMEDALCGLPAMTSVSYFLLTALLARWSRLSYPVTTASYVAYQVWLAAWGGMPDGSFIRRISAAFPLGLIAALAIGTVLRELEGRSAIDEKG